MSNNPLLYNAIISGVTGGAQNRWLESTDAADYQQVRDAAAVLATVIDTQIATTEVSNSDATLMASICQGVMDSRYLTSTDAADYSAIAASIITLYNEVKSEFDDIPFVADEPLAHTRFVDPDTDVDEADQTGSATAPYSSIQFALDALSNEGGTIVLAGGVYTNAVFEIPDVPFQIIGLGITSSVGAFLYTDNLTIQNVKGITGVSASALGELRLIDCVVTGNVLCNTALYVSGAYNDPNGAAILGNVETLNIDALGCQLAGVNFTGTATFSNVCFRAGSVVDTGDGGRMIDCDFVFPGGVSILTGSFAVDKTTYNRILAKAVNIAAASLSLAETPIFLDVAITPPVLAAGAVGYTNVPLAGTVLANTPVDSPMAINPRADFGPTSIRISAANTARVGFVGVTAAVAVNFRISRL